MEMAELDCSGLEMKSLLPSSSSRRPQCQRMMLTESEGGLLVFHKERSGLLSVSVEVVIGGGIG